MCLYKWFTTKEHVDLFIARVEMLFRGYKYFRKFKDEKIGDKQEL
jgi:hypothetical protein